MTQPSNPAVASGEAPRKENLALIYQEAFTATVRLRSNRQAVADASSFRAHMHQLLQHAEQEARAAGYAGEDARLATFALVAFLDESVLNLRSPIFADWPRRPLQEELFGGHVAGEIFFQSLQRLLGRTDSEDLADLLEVFYLALLLGYRGRYGVGSGGELQELMRSIADKIRRIRKDTGELSPRWAPPPEPLGARRDPWIRWLKIGAIASLAMVLLFFSIFKLTLSSGASHVQAVVIEDQG